MSIPCSSSAVTSLMVCVGLTAVLPREVTGQAQPQAQTRASVRCESSNASYQRCPATGAWQGARLVQQISTSPCIQGRTWGFDQNAIWVADGCRGIFEAGNAFANVGERVTCAGDGRTECPADTRHGVTLSRKLSQAACTEGTSWGYGNNVIWVDRGCRAEFQVKGPTSGGGGGGGSTVTVPCGTTSGQQVTCKTGGYATNVRLSQDQSGGRCRQGQTWGHTDSFIWANNGCRGQFTVTLQGSGSGNTGSTVVSCGSASGRQVICETEGYATNVTLQRDQSGGRCLRNQTWGFTDSFIWANEGCRGDFLVSYAAGGGGGGDVARRITCGSSDPQGLGCRPGGTVRSARLVRDLSGSRCRQNTTWGYAADSLWVANGCIGEFTLTVSPGR